MLTLFEFLGKEEIENVITCLHYQVDKVVFFGYQEDIETQKNRLERFLRKYCDVQDLQFVPLSHKSFSSITKVMSEVIETEKKSGADVYFDVTGGESLALVAFGALASKFDAPMHVFDIEKNRLYELDADSEPSSENSSVSDNTPIGKSISTAAAPKDIKLDVDMWIELKGGVVNHYMQKEFKGDEDLEFKQDVGVLWDIMQERPDMWNPFIDFINNHLKPEQEWDSLPGEKWDSKPEKSPVNLAISVRTKDLNQFFQSRKSRINSAKKLQSMLRKLADAGIIKDYRYDEEVCSFKYKNENMLHCLTEGGSVLELHVYYQEKEQADDCMVGVHLDWDGVIHRERGVDVLNEVDVLTMNGNIPTFISCKSGKMNTNQILHALYELDAVTDKFGGRYAKKMLAATQEIPEIYVDRAKEMDIKMY